MVHVGTLYIDRGGIQVVVVPVGLLVGGFVCVREMRKYGMYGGGGGLLDSRIIIFFIVLQ